MLLDFQGVEKKVEILEKKLALLDAKPELFETPGQNNGKNCVELSFGLWAGLIQQVQVPAVPNGQGYDH